jgi:hypothetical protein
MKVVGTGAPDALTIQFEPCEREILLDELRHQRSSVVEDAARSQGRAGRSGEDKDLEESHDHLLVLARVLHQVEAAPRDAEVIVVLGPTWFLRDVIHGATAEAIERLCKVVDDFRQLRVEPRPTPEQLQAAVKVAGAWVETLVGYHYVDWHGFE